LTLLLQMGRNYDSCPSYIFGHSRKYAAKFL